MQTPNTEAAAGAAPPQERSKATFSEVCKKYGELFRKYGKPQRNSETDIFLLDFCQQTAKKLFSVNLSVLAVKQGFDQYSILFAEIDGVPPISLNYIPTDADGQLEIVVIGANGKELIKWQPFNLSQLWNENEFVKNFLYFGKFSHYDSFLTIHHRNGKRGEFERNPTREFFHNVLIGNF